MYKNCWLRVGPLAAAICLRLTRSLYFIRFSRWPTAILRVAVKMLFVPVSTATRRAVDQRNLPHCKVAGQHTEFTHVAQLQVGVPFGLQVVHLADIERPRIDVQRHRTRAERSR